MLKMKQNKTILLKQIKLVKKNIIYYSKVYNPNCLKVKKLIIKLEELKKQYKN